MEERYYIISHYGDSICQHYYDNYYKAKRIFNLLLQTSKPNRIGLYDAITDDVIKYLVYKEEKRKYESIY